MKHLLKLHDSLYRSYHIFHLTNSMLGWCGGVLMRVSLDRVIRYNHFIWKEYSVHDPQSARKKKDGFVLQQHPGWKIHRN